MEYNEEYDLILNHISYGELLQKNEKRFQEYMSMAASWLKANNKGLFESELLARHPSVSSVEEILQQYTKHYVPGIQKRKDKAEPVYYNIWGMEVIENPADPFFPFFFVCKLSHVRVVEIGSFLDYQLERNFRKDKTKFFSFLKLAIREYNYLIGDVALVTIQEWMDMREKEQVALKGIEENDIGFKGRFARQAGDKLTALNLVQTALLIQYMQRNAIILQDEYLTYSQAGKAFSILTGYSANTLRQQLGTKGEIEGAKYEDYKELYEALMRLVKSIEREIKKK